MADVSIEQIEFEDKEKRGLIDLGDKIIYCYKCNSPLYNVIKVGEATQKYKVKVLCPCGASSFFHKLDGNLYGQAHDGMVVTDIKTETKGDEIEMVIEVKNG